MTVIEKRYKVSILLKLPNDFILPNQFLELKRTENAKSTIKNALKKDRKKKSILIEISPRTRKKMQEAKERYFRNPQSRRQYRKRKYQENPEQQKEYEKRNARKILSQRKSMKKRNIRKILSKKEDTEKVNIRTNLYEKGNMKKTNMTKILNQKKKIAKRCIKRTKDV